ncbi:MAG: hypothetical protein KAH22_07020 [Thiotrichaceae bacterium]|nr:hypothetical protein [Thiotrichaceae bacterium]
MTISLTNVASAGHFPLGINTNEVMQVDSSAPFVNIFKMSLPFDEAATIHETDKNSPMLTRGSISYDHNGWPRNLNGGQAGTALIHWLPVNSLPNGHYTVLYDGEGTLRYGDDATVISSTSGKDVIKIIAGADKFLKVTLMITKSNPQNYLRNIRVLMPGGICANNPFKRVGSARECRGNYQSFEQHHEQIVFNPDYLAFMKDFNTIRFMNMSGITRNPLTSWAQMPHLDEATWAGREGRRGAPLEIMVKLANKLNRNAWFNIPERANDDLVRRYAQYVKKNLRPHLKVYIEYTNEAWNPRFTAARYVRSKGVQQGYGQDHNAGHRYYSVRAGQVMRIWKQVFGRSNQLTRVLGAWSANPKLTKQFLEYPNVVQNFDAVAIAPYFFVHYKVESQVNSVPSVFKLLEDDVNPYSLNNVKKMIEKQRTEVSKHRLKLIAYEGGQHLYTPKNRSSKDIPSRFYIGANRAHPMEKMYIKFLQDWNQASGSGLFALFSAPRTYQVYGSWGLKEHINQPDHQAPKYRAIKRFF